MDSEHNLYGTAVIRPDPALVERERAEMDQPRYEMDERRREIVLGAIREVCEHRGWFLHAAHIRTAHVHVVVQAGESPEKGMNDFKSYASRALNRAGLDNEGESRDRKEAVRKGAGRKDAAKAQQRKRWSRHGSTRYIWNEEQLHRAITYVVYEQGAPMSMFYRNRYQCGDGQEADSSGNAA